MNGRGSWAGHRTDGNKVLTWINTNFGISKMERRICWRWILTALVSCTAVRVCAQEGTPSPEPYYGALVGSLSDPQQIGIQGDIYVINMTTFQIIGFKYSGGVTDLHFWLDESDMLTGNGYRIITFEFGDQPLKPMDMDRVVLWSSDANVNNYRTIGLYSQSQKKSYSSVNIPKNVLVPSVQFLTEELRPSDAGRRYKVYSGPIMIMDRRRLKVFGFVFDTVRAPKTHFYVGRGLEPKKSNGKPVAVRGFQSPNYVAAIQKAYTGDQDIILELPEDYDIHHIDWLSVFCSQFNIDFGHVKIGSDISPNIPPYVPLQRKHDQKETPMKKPWPLNVLSGLKRHQFKFQLGPPGFDRSYGKWARAEPAERLWYVNGQMTPQIWVQRGITYTFTVEGGLSNALYITNVSMGGYGIQAEYEKKNTAIFAGLKDGKPLDEPATRSFGRNCTWIPRGSTPADSEKFDSFLEFKRTLRLKCEEGGSAGTFQWTPDISTPGALYYQSYSAPHMGFDIVVVDEVPADIPDVNENMDEQASSPVIGGSLETEEDENEETGEEELDYEEDERPGGSRRESSQDGDGPIPHVINAAPPCSLSVYTATLACIYFLYFAVRAR